MKLTVSKRFLLPVIAVLPFFSGCSSWSPKDHSDGIKIEHRMFTFARNTNKQVGKINGEAIFSVPLIIGDRISLLEEGKPLSESSGTICKSYIMVFYIEDTELQYTYTTTFDPAYFELKLEGKGIVTAYLQPSHISGLVEPTTVHNLETDGEINFSVEQHTGDISECNEYD